MSDFSEKKTVLQKVDMKLVTNARAIMGDRYKNNLAKLNMRELGFTEFTRLVTRTPSWNKVAQELRTIPKKKK